MSERAGAVVKKIIGIVLLATIVFAVVVVVVAHVKFGAITASPQVSHSVIANPDTRLVVAIHVPLAQSFIYDTFLWNTPVPSSVLSYFLPYEIALIATPDVAVGDMKVTLFLNDQRLEPVIRDQIERLSLPEPLDRIFAGNVVVKQPGVLVKENSLRMDPAMLQLLRRQWPDKVSEPLKGEDHHLIDAVLDNRDGGAIAAIVTLAGAAGEDIASRLHENYLGFIANIGTFRLQADLASDNEAKVHIEVECPPGTEAGQVGVLAMALQMGFQQGKIPLIKMGMRIHGSIPRIDGTKIEADYTVSNFSSLLAGLIPVKGIAAQSSAARREQPAGL